MTETIVRPVLSAADAGHRLGLAPATVHRLGLDGKLERVEVRTRAGRVFYYPLEDVDRLVRDRGGRRTPQARQPRRDRGDVRGPAGEGYVMTRLRDMRHKRGMTTRELARLAGVGHPTVVNAEKANHVVYATTANKLADALGVRLAAVADYSLRG